MPDSQEGSLEYRRDIVGRITDYVTLAGAIISTWYLADLCTDGKSTEWAARQWHGMVAGMKRRRKQDVAGWVMFQAEEVLRKANQDES